MDQKDGKILGEWDAALRGTGQFAEDMAPRDALWLCFARSPVAYGALRRVEAGDAATLPSVTAVLTHADLPPLGALTVAEPLPLHARPDCPVLAEGQVLWAGQPVAAVLGESLNAARDGADAVEVEVADAPLPAPTAIAERHWSSGDVDAAFATAAHVVEAHVQQPRLAPTPMEPRAITIRHDGAGTLTIWHSTQTPHRTRSELASILGVDPARLRVIATHVGGAFGMKASLYPEEIVAVWAALHLRRSVRWQATRGEDFLSATHGRGLRTWGRLALDVSGRFTAMEARITAPLGHWLPTSGLIPALNAARVLPSGYDIPSVRIHSQAMIEALPPTGIYRGAGRPEAILLMEKLVGRAAKVLNQTDIEIRQANLVHLGSDIKETATGNNLDSGDYAALLKHLTTSTNLPTRYRDQASRRAAGEFVGLGIAFYVENSGEGWEAARVTLTGPDTALIASGSSSQGQGRLLSYRKIAAEALGLPLENISATAGDTGTCPEGIGALASRSTAIGGSAVLAACQAARAQQQAGAPYPVTAELRYENDGMAWGCGAMLVQMSIDRETGQPTLEHVACVDDAGRVIDPALVAGQMQGGFAQGLGEALMERVVFDADGQLLTGSLMDYALPRATDVPPVQLSSLHSPSPLNLLGAKGVGEAGTIAAPPAILLAALDALAPLGVTDLDMPLTPQTLWHAMEDAKESR